MIVTTIAKIRAWEPEMQDDLLEEEGGVTAGLGHVDENIECLQHFVQVAGRNAPNHEPGWRTAARQGQGRNGVCTVFQSHLHIAQGAARAVIAASVIAALRHITQLSVAYHHRRVAAIRLPCRLEE